MTSVSTSALTDESGTPATIVCGKLDPLAAGWLGLSNIAAYSSDVEETTRQLALASEKIQGARFAEGVLGDAVDRVSDIEALDLAEHLSRSRAAAVPVLVRHAKNAVVALSKLPDLCNSLEAARAEICRLELQCAATDATLVSAQEEITRLSVVNAKPELACTNADANTEALERRVRDLEHKVDAKKEALRAHEEAAKRRIAALEAELMELRCRNATQQGTINALQPKQPKKRAAPPPPPSEHPAPPNKCNGTSTVGCQVVQPLDLDTVSADDCATLAAKLLLLMLDQSRLEGLDRSRLEGFVRSMTPGGKAVFARTLALMRIVVATGLPDDIPATFHALGLRELVEENLRSLAADPLVSARFRSWAGSRLQAPSSVPSSTDALPTVPRKKPRTGTAKQALVEALAALDFPFPATEAAKDMLWWKLYSLVNVLLGMLMTARARAFAPDATSAARRVYATSLSSVVAMLDQSFETLRLGDVPVSQWDPTVAEFLGKASHDLKASASGSSGSVFRAALVSVMNTPPQPDDDGIRGDEADSGVDGDDDVDGPVSSDAEGSGGEEACSSEGDSSEEGDSPVIRKRKCKGKGKGPSKKGKGPSETGKGPSKKGKGLSKKGNGLSKKGKGPSKKGNGLSKPRLVPVDDDSKSDQLTVEPADLPATHDAPTDQPMAEAEAEAEAADVVQPTAGTAHPPEPLSGIQCTEHEDDDVAFCAEDKFFDKHLGHLLDKKTKPNDAT